MNVVDERIPDDEFAEFLKQMPQVSVEMVLKHGGSVLLVKRTNAPAEGEWFWPGTRLYKGEGFRDAVRRLGQEELGIEVDIHGLLGVYNHFWESGRLDGVDETHTVNVVYHTSPKRGFDIQLDNQHEEYRLIDEKTPELNRYVKTYLDDSGVLD